MSEFGLSQELAAAADAEELLGKHNVAALLRRRARSAAQLEAEVRAEQLALLRAVERQFKRDKFMYSDAKFAKVVAAEAEQYRVQARVELSIKAREDAADSMPEDWMEKIDEEAPECSGQSE